MKIFLIVSIINYLLNLSLSIPSSAEFEMKSNNKIHSENGKIFIDHKNIQTTLLYKASADQQINDEKTSVTFIGWNDFLLKKVWRQLILNQEMCQMYVEDCEPSLDPFSTIIKSFEAQGDNQQQMTQGDLNAHIITGEQGKPFESSKVTFSKGINQEWNQSNQSSGPIDDSVFDEQKNQPCMNLENNTKTIEMQAKYHLTELLTIEWYEIKLNKVEILI